MINILHNQRNNTPYLLEHCCASPLAAIATAGLFFFFLVAASSKLRRKLLASAFGIRGLLLGTLLGGHLLFPWRRAVHIPLWRRWYRGHGRTAFHGIARIGLIQDPKEKVCRSIDIAVQAVRDRATWTVAVWAKLLAPDNSRRPLELGASEMVVEE